MLKKYITPLVLLSSFAYSAQLKNEKFEVIAKNINSSENIMTAKGNVVIFSPTYYLSADKIVYNKEKETFELFDNVLILKDNNIQTQSNYAFINLKNNNYTQTPVLLFEKQNNLWMNSKSSSKNDNLIELEESIISSCDCIDPAWSIRVSSASYDTEDKWLNTFNTRLYIKNIPLFYTPYFGFPTDKTRRTGLLTPTIGYSSSEGMHYSQPIYFAPSADFDLEFIPQIRNQRGHGAYTYLRYADSAYSTLNLQTGFFKEKYNYFTENDLKNRKHYGWDIDYERTKLFSNSNTQDGLYASIKWLNDIEYRTLEKDDDSLSTEKKVESKINYFYNTSKYYTGLYGKFYIDTAKDSNDETLQELPKVQFHKYNESLFLDKLLYSIDTNATNYTRNKGINANIYEVSVPISYSQYFFDDYINLKVKNRTVLNRYDYSNSDELFENGTLVQNETSVSISSDLIKEFDDYLHTVNLDATYTHPTNVKEDGDLYKLTNDNTDLSVFPVAQGKKNINLSLNESLYSKDDSKQIINHKLSQSILYNDADEAKLQNLENYLKIYLDNSSISNKITYNIQDKQFIENTADFNYKYENLSFDIGYYKSKDTPNSGKEDLESYRVTTSYDISRDYKIGYYQNYNMLEHIRNKQAFTFTIDDRCWNLELKYEKEVTPSTTTNLEANNQRIVFFTLTLKPLGGIKQKYKLKENSDD
ncbi:LPS-assembly protein LptD [Poseidonibacter sp.]|uniref:LPS-assembly protein LptD n=1 Tax=Poseidonibacter sp. TaxID=2321188 RepID=UPI003C723298